MHKNHVTIKIRGETLSLVMSVRAMENDGRHKQMGLIDCENSKGRSQCRSREQSFFAID